MDHHEHYSNNEKGCIRTRLKKIRHLNNIVSRESFCYHESGHTVMSILLHGWYEYQIQHRFGWVAVSTSKNIHHVDLDAREALWMLLAGFAAQRLQETDVHSENHGQKMLDYSIEHKYTPLLAQPDTLLWLYILRREFKKITWKNMTNEQQKLAIKAIVNYITNFFKSEPKIMNLIKILSNLNLQKSIINREDINQCIVQAWITGKELVEIANRFRNAPILQASTISSLLSSAE